MIDSWQFIERYGNKGYGSTSYVPHSICDELITIMTKSVIKSIVKRLQKSRDFSISVNLTTDIRYTDQLCIT